MASYRGQNPYWQMDDGSRSAARERLASRQRNSGREVPGSSSPRGVSPWNPPTRGSYGGRSDGYSRGYSDGYSRGYSGGYSRPPMRGGIGGMVASLRDMSGILMRVGVVLAVLLLALAVFFIMPISIQVEGKQVDVARSTTYQSLLDQGYLTSKPGNLLAVDGSLLEEGAGNAPVVYANDEPVDLGAMVIEGASIRSEQGSDATESYTSVQDVIPVETRIARDEQAEAQGAEANKFNFYNGILHVVVDKGQEGYGEQRTGDISGITVTAATQEMKPRVIENVHAELPSNQKLIALTFDDGPSPNEGETQDVLDVLEKYDAVGSFFMLGTEAESYPEMAKKVADAGHQVCSHSYNHGADHFLNNTTEDDVRYQLQTARDVIAKATGVEPLLVRPPGGNVDVKAIEAAGTLADGYIGWSIDPHDYDRPGADAIAQAMIDQAAPGAVVLLHDGGGDRSQTVAALDKAIPQLQKMGYTFVTLDTLIDAVLAYKGYSTN